MAIQFLIDSAINIAKKQEGWDSFTVRKERPPLQ
jgi:hypothetical protein